MITKLYSLYDTPFDHDVCHLFEHTIIRGFSQRLGELGHGRALFGWLNGHTIDSSILFDMGAYDDEIAQQFDDYLSGLEKFESVIIDDCLAHIEAELRSKLVVSDRPLLERQLGDLIRMIKLPNGNVLIGDNLGSPILVKNKPDLFSEIVILIRAHDIGPDVQKAFLCLYPTILDIIREAALSRESAYPLGESAIAASAPASIGIMWRFVVRESVDMRYVQQTTNEHLKDFDVSQLESRIDKFRESFKEDPSVNSMLVRFYDQTNIKTTREELACLATAENLSKLVRSTDIEIRQLTGKFKEVDWISPS